MLCVFFFLLILGSSNGIRHNFGDDYTRNTHWPGAISTRFKIHIHTLRLWGVDEANNTFIMGPFFITIGDSGQKLKTYS